jgi:CBS domain-containing protein
VFPVVDGSGRPVGVIGLKDVANASRDDWRSVRTSDIMKPLSEDNTVAADAPAYKVLQQMQRRQNSRLLVTDGHTLKGIITLRDIMSYLAVRDELEQDTQTTPAAAPRA